MQLMLFGLSLWLWQRHRGGAGKAIDKEAIFRLRWKCKKLKSWSTAQTPCHAHCSWIQTTIIMLLHKPSDIYIMSFYNMFTKRPFHSWKTECLEPWTVPMALKAMNKTFSAIMMKESASPTHLHTGSDALSVEPVSQHWLLVVILSRDWSWQS